uniref:Uncharacterized protein n=1 Tax=Octopus bimaculoides TaxID=37653 RepID=A0A0L8G5W3_OCTBM
MEICAVCVCVHALSNRPWKTRTLGSCMFGIACFTNFVRQRTACARKTYVLYILMVCILRNAKDGLAN